MNVLDISVFCELFKTYPLFFKSARKFLMFLLYGSTSWFKKMNVVKLTGSYTDLPLPANCTRGHFQTWEIRGISDSLVVLRSMFQTSPELEFVKVTS